MKRKQGISLIVLVITIIVMVVLVAAVVLSLSNTGIINKANQAVDISNEKQVQNLAAIVWADAYMDNKREGDLSKEVKDKLKEYGIEEDKWEIEVSNTGVNIKRKEIIIQTIPEGAVYYRGVTSKRIGDYSGATETYTVGQDFPATVNDGDIYVCGDYEYRYNMQYASGVWYDKTGSSPALEYDGWGVKVIDTKKTTYGEILTSINNEPIATMRETFSYCKFLEKIPKMPDSVKNMIWTFRGCTSLVSLDGVVIPFNVTNLSRTFEDCTALIDLSNFIIPNTVTELSLTFMNCTSLEVAPSIPNSVTNIGQAFQYCSSLTVAPVIPNSVTRMTSTFYECTSLKNAPAIPNSVTNLYSTFYGCTSLTGTITINVDTYHPNLFSNVDFEAQKITLAGDATDGYLDKYGSTGLNYCSVCNGYCKENH